jgi:tricorn protease-like protein
MKSKTMMKSAALVAAAFTLATVNSPAQSKVDVNAIAKYVYPGNIAESPKSFTYLPDGESYLLLDNDGKAINRYETSSGKLLETVLDVTHTRENSVGSIESFKLSPDGTKILLYTTKTPVYRHSFKADWYVFEIKRNILRPLSKEFKQQQSPLFSPDGRMVAFVVDNNIYIKKIDYDSEVAVTKDGAIDKVSPIGPTRRSLQPTALWRGRPITQRSAICAMMRSVCLSSTSRSIRAIAKPRTNMPIIPAHSPTNIRWPVRSTRWLRSTATM